MQWGTGHALSAKGLEWFYVAIQALACSKASRKRWAGKARVSVSCSTNHCPGEPVKIQVWGIPTVDFHVAGRNLISLASSLGDF